MVSVEAKRKNSTVWISKREAVHSNQNGRDAEKTPRAGDISSLEDRFQS